MKREAAATSWRRPRERKFPGRMALLGVLLAMLAASLLLPQPGVAGLVPAQKINPELSAPGPAPAAEQPQAPVPAPAKVRGADAIPEQNKFYDPENPSYDRLQKANESLVGFPLDKKGYVDWMGAIRSGFIKPRADLRGKEEMQVLDLDVLLKDTRQMPYVKFPHNSHTLWLACSNCHPKPFEPKAGANDISMAAIFQGQYCGMCHDRVAFITFFSCERCHNVPHGETKAWW